MIRFDQFESLITYHIIFDQLGVFCQQLSPVTCYITHPQMILYELGSSLGYLLRNVLIVSEELYQLIQLLLVSIARHRNIVDPWFHGGIKILQPFITNMKHKRPAENNFYFCKNQYKNF